MKHIFPSCSYLKHKNHPSYTKQSSQLRHITFALLFIPSSTTLNSNVQKFSFYIPSNHDHIFTLPVEVFHRKKREAPGRGAFFRFTSLISWSYYCTHLTNINNNNNHNNQCTVLLAFLCSLQK